MKLAPSFLFLLNTSFVSAAVISPLATGSRTDDPVTGSNDWTLDAGLALGAITANPNRVIFEAGGDGTGSALALIGNDLVYYLDQGDYLASSPGPDFYTSLDISSLSGSVISIRLDVDLATANDSITLSATDGITLLSTILNPTSDISNAAGGNDTGFGVVAADLAGLDEAAEPGFPDLAQFQNATYFTDGANALGPDALAGILYTSAADIPPASLPDPSSWGLIPEPHSGLLASLALIMAMSHRRRN